MAKATDTRKFNGGEDVEYMVNGETFTGVVAGVRYQEDGDGIRYNFKYLINHPIETEAELAERQRAADEANEAEEKELLVQETRELEFSASELNALNTTN